MLTFSKVSDDGATCTYAYTPEGQGAPGEVTVSRFDGGLVAKKLAPTDEFGAYSSHILARLRECARSGEWPENGTVAWG